MTAAKNEDTSTDPAQGGSYKLAKTLLLLLLVLDLGAAGAWVYFKLVSLKQLKRELSQNERYVVKAREQMRNLRAAVSTIRDQKLGRIDNPGSVILGLAEKYSLQDKVKAERPLARRWKSTNYEEVTVRVNFIEKEGYAFGDLIRFLQSIEQKNPRLMIRDVDFGKRQQTKDDLGPHDLWRPTGPALVVRTFRLMK